jgi:O-antigen ligase
MNAVRRGIASVGTPWLAVFCAWTLVIMMVTPEGFEYASTGMKTSGSAASRLTWLALLGVGAVLAIWQLPRARAIIRNANPFLWLFFGLALASALWSDDSGVTLRRMLRFAAIIGVGLSLTLVKWQPRRLQDTLKPMMAAFLVGSVIFCLTSPQLAIEQLQLVELAGAWKGLATQKNGLGSLAGLGAVLWMHAMLTRQGNFGTNIGCFLVAGLCLVMSRSSTSLFATIFAILGMMLMLNRAAGVRRAMPYLVGLLTAVLLLYSVAVMNVVPGLDFVLKPITLATGKDLTFSGRTAIWDILRAHMAYRPWFGGGYGAYWLGVIPGTASYEMLLKLEFYPTEGHNGYLDVLNDLGWAGGAVLIGYLVVHLRQCLTLLRLQRTQGALYLALFFQQLVANLSESRWFNVFSVEFAFQVLITLALARALADLRAPQPVTAAHWAY